MPWHDARLCRGGRIGLISPAGTGGLCAGRDKRLSIKARPSRPPDGAIAMSMQNVVSPAISVTPPKRQSLRHIPGDEGWPIIGRTLSILADPKGEVERMAAKYGPVYRSHVLGETSITALGPEANELLLFDQQKLFSSTHGWAIVL